MAIYFIGGSPCSGKSTIASALAERYDLRYFKVDDHLDRYIKMGVADRKACCIKLEKLSSEQIWMRDPLAQCEEELQIYQEIFNYILKDLEDEDSQKGMITEGAAYLPVLAKRGGIPFAQYLSITPTKEFQVFHYSQREWVPHVLEGCSDKAKAFENWMERDALFARAIRRQCKELGYASIVNDGNIPVGEMIHQAVVHFGLEQDDRKQT